MMARAQVGIPRWIALTPMAFGLLALPALIGASPCRLHPTCEAVWNIWSMVGSLFPHILVLSIHSFLQRPIVSLLLTLLLDVALLAIMWRVLPPRIGPRTLVAVWSAWAVATFVADYYFPYMMEGAWRLRPLFGWAMYPS